MLCRRLQQLLQADAHAADVVLPSGSGATRDCSSADDVADGHKSDTSPPPPHSLPPVTEEVATQIRKQGGNTMEKAHRCVSAMLEDVHQAQERASSSLMRARRHHVRSTWSPCTTPQGISWTKLSGNFAPGQHVQCIQHPCIHDQAFSGTYYFGTGA